MSIKIGEKEALKKKPPVKIHYRGDKEEAKMLTQNSKLAFRKHKPPKTFQLFADKTYYLSNIF
ncbi:MAG TPA: hypothetical protein PK514_12235 [Spirochaetota bacterium]|nr:hypothetical protein [Spirochaetota bacterium]